MFKSIDVSNFLALPLVVDGPNDTLRHNRTIAARTWYMIQEGQDVAVAMKFFDKNVKGEYGIGRNRMALIRKWGKRFAKTGMVHDANTSRSGRRRRLSKQLVLWLVQKFLDGYKVKGEQYYFTDINDAVQKSPWFATATQAPTGVTPGHLWRLMTEEVPSLHLMKRKEDIKSELPPKVKAIRKEAARKLRLWSLPKLQRIVWIDAKKVHIEKGGVKVYSAKNDMVIAEPSLLLGNRNTGMVLHYYAAVNALVGVVHFGWVTGTTDLELERGYTYPTMVRPGVTSLSCKCCCLLCTLISLVDTCTVI